MVLRKVIDLFIQMRLEHLGLSQPGSIVLSILWSPITRSCTQFWLGALNYKPLRSAAHLTTIQEFHLRYLFRLSFLRSLLRETIRDGIVLPRYIPEADLHILFRFVHCEISV